MRERVAKNLMSKRHYYTRHELEFLRSLDRRSKHATLRKLHSVYRLRSWDGDGMRVDARAVLTFLDALIAVRESAA
jgi:uncharacterized protein (UPF0216 family)